jgi:peptidoglycan hydrolase-like protein with peptidoglycan-binding domain
LVERVEQAKQQGERNTQARQRDERQTERGAYGSQGEKTRAQQGEQRQNDRGLFERASEDQQRLPADQMSAEQIRKVQQQLNKEGFHAGSVDGKWSSQTQSAIRNFQESKGLQVTGQLDERTLDELGLDADEFREQSQPENKTGADQSSR